MTIDWSEAAVALKRDVTAHGGFLTLQRDAFRERFDIGRLAERNTEELIATLSNHGMIVLPHPYFVQATALRIYDVESEIGKIAQAIDDPENVPETALAHAVHLHERAAAGKRRGSHCVPWLTALDVFLQLVISKQPEGWEELDDNREHFQLLEALAASLGLPDGIIHGTDTIRMARMVWACRPRVPRWDGASPELAAVLAEAARMQKYIFNWMLPNAGKHLLGGAELPTRDVDLGRIGLRYRHEG